MSHSRAGPVILLALLAQGCVTVPSGPAVMVLPGTGKTFDQFRADDADCRQYAQAQIGITPENAAVTSGVNSALVGTILGAALGAAANGSQGAAVGAGTGLAFGGLVGTGTAYESGYGLQRRYDYGFQQCMYARGHRVPVSGSFTNGAAWSSSNYYPYPPPPPNWRPH